jgi:hypothetical protein
VDALYPVELDVRGGRGAGDEGHGPALALYRVLEAGEGFGDEANYLILPNHAQVVVGQEGERPAALGASGVEDDAGLSSTSTVALPVFGKSVSLKQVMNSATRTRDEPHSVSRFPAYLTRRTIRTSDPLRPNHSLCDAGLRCAQEEHATMVVLDPRDGG